VSPTKGLATVSKEEIARASEDLAFLSPIEEIIEEARNGRMFILVDDEDRENEGDLVIPAQMATPEAINFMAKFGRGLICLSMTQERVDYLGLVLMPRTNSDRFSTAFTVSIEAREGVTTGISAPDRARTIAVAIDAAATGGDLTTPGHIFPLAAREGGVLMRAGHTEAAVDLARLAGMNPSGVICEIMGDDGEMARLPELISFAQFHGLKIGAIEDLIAYRRRFDQLVSRVNDAEFVSEFGGEFKAIVYENKITGTEHIALIKGDMDASEPLLVRMHALNVFDDLLGNQSSGKAGELQRAMRMIGDEGRGVVVLIREPISSAVSASVSSDQEKAESTEAGEAAANPEGELRSYGVGAQILQDLGVHEMILLTNSILQDLGVHEMILLTNSNRTVVGLHGYDLEIVDRRPISMDEK